MDGAEFHALLRAAHVATGFAGLALFWIPALARKGSRLHIATGRLFVACALFVGTTGLAASLWGIVDPLGFIGGAAGRDPNSEEARRAFADLRVLLSITGFLGLGLLSGVALGIAAQRHGGVAGGLRRPGVLATAGAFLLWGGVIALLAAVRLSASGLEGGLLREWLPLTLGAVGVYGGISDLRIALGPALSPAEQRDLHAHCMISAGAGFHAAFLVFGLSRLG